MRRKLIAGNWKMYKTTAEAVALVEEINEGRRGRALGHPRRAALHLAGRGGGRGQRQPGRRGRAEHALREGGRLHGRGLARRCSRTSAVGNVILGHSERRQFFGETDDDGRARRRTAALAARPHADRLRGRDAGRARGGHAPWRSSSGRSDAISNGVAADEAKTVVIAYEPVWAIGTGKVATPRAGAGGPRVHPHAPRGEARRRRRRRGAHPLRRQRQARQRRGPDGAARTSTARSSAEPRSRPTRSSSSSTTTSSRRTCQDRHGPGALDASARGRGVFAEGTHTRRTEPASQRTCPGRRAGHTRPMDRGGNER